VPKVDSELPRALAQTVFNSIADWVGRYRQKLGPNNQFWQCTPDEVMRVARDLKLTPMELKELASKGPNAADLLLKMLSALHVDRKALENSDPNVMQDLQRLCTTCGAKKRCERELADGTAVDHFQEFCPNAFTLDALLSRKAQSSSL
jgi:hypothetical protein